MKSNVWLRMVRRLLIRLLLSVFREHVLAIALVCYGIYSKLSYWLNVKKAYACKQISSSYIDENP